MDYFNIKRENNNLLKDSYESAFQPGIEFNDATCTMVLDFNNVESILPTFDYEEDCVEMVEKIFRRFKKNDFKKVLINFTGNENNSKVTNFNEFLNVLVSSSFIKVTKSVEDYLKDDKLTKIINFLNSFWTSQEDNKLRSCCNIKLEFKDHNELTNISINYILNDIDHLFTNNSNNFKSFYNLPLPKSLLINNNEFIYQNYKLLNNNKLINNVEIELLCNEIFNYNDKNEEKLKLLSIIQLIRELTNENEEFLNYLLIKNDKHDNIKPTKIVLNYLTLIKKLLNYDTNNIENEKLFNNLISELKSTSLDTIKLNLNNFKKQLYYLTFKNLNLIINNNFKLLFNYNYSNSNNIINLLNICSVENKKSKEYNWYDFKLYYFIEIWKINIYKSFYKDHELFKYSINNESILKFKELINNNNKFDLIKLYTINNNTNNLLIIKKEINIKLNETFKNNKLFKNSLNQFEIYFPCSIINRKFNLNELLIKTNLLNLTNKLYSLTLNNEFKMSKFNNLIYYDLNLLNELLNNINLTNSFLINNIKLYTDEEFKIKLLLTKYYINMNCYGLSYYESFNYIINSTVNVTNKMLKFNIIKKFNNLNCEEIILEEEENESIKDEKEFFQFEADVERIDLIKQEEDIFMKNVTNLPKKINVSLIGNKKDDSGNKIEEIEDDVLSDVQIVTNLNQIKFNEKRKSRSNSHLLQNETEQLELKKLKLNNDIGEEDEELIEHDTNSNSSINENLKELNNCIKEEEEEEEEEEDSITNDSENLKELILNNSNLTNNQYYNNNNNNNIILLHKFISLIEIYDQELKLNQNTKIKFITFKESKLFIKLASEFMVMNIQMIAMYIDINSRSSISPTPFKLLSNSSIIITKFLNPILIKKILTCLELIILNYNNNINDNVFKYINEFGLLDLISLILNNVIISMKQVEIQQLNKNLKLDKLKLKLTSKLREHLFLINSILKFFEFISEFKSKNNNQINQFHLWFENSNKLTINTFDKLLLILFNRIDGINKNNDYYLSILNKILKIINFLIESESLKNYINYIRNKLNNKGLTKNLINLLLLNVKLININNYLLIFNIIKKLVLTNDNNNNNNNKLNLINNNNNNSITTTLNNTFLNLFINKLDLIKILLNIILTINNKLILFSSINLYLILIKLNFKNYLKCNTRLFSFIILFKLFECCNNIGKINDLSKFKYLIEIIFSIFQLEYNIDKNLKFNKLKIKFSKDFKMIFKSELNLPIELFNLFNKKLINYFDSTNYLLIIKLIKSRYEIRCYNHKESVKLILIKLIKKFKFNLTSIHEYKFLNGE